jgi:hypothetical protein
VNEIGLGSCPFAGFVVIGFEHSSSATRELVNCKAGCMVIGYEVVMRMGEGWNSLQ